MKNIKLLLLLLFFFTQIGYSQNSEISILLKDAVTNLPIEDATVFIVKTKQNLLSNSQGIVTFALNGPTNISISHTSYLPLTIRSTTLKDVQNIILLKSDDTQLDEIIITKQNPQKILKTIVSNSIEKLSTPARLKVYSREFFKLNGTYSYYNDGLMNFQISGKTKDFKTDILVEQNRSFGLVEQDVSEDLQGYNLNNIMENYYNFKYLNPILESKAKKTYDFLIKGYPLNPDYYQMKITPLDDSKGNLDEFTVLYDKKKKIIIEVSSTISPVSISKSKSNKTEGSKNIYKSIFKTTYKIDSSNYYLLYSKEEIGYEHYEKKKTVEIEIRNYLLTTNFSTKKYSFKESDIYKDKALFNKKNVVLTDYWNVSGMTATEEEQKIIEEIKENN